MEQEARLDGAMREQFRADLESVMRLPEGRRLLLSVFGNICRVHAVCFEENARQTDFALGRRSVGLELIQMVDAVAPDLYLKAQQEYRAWREEWKLRQRKEEEKA